MVDRARWRRARRAARRSRPTADGRTTSGRAPSWDVMRQTWAAVARSSVGPIGRQDDAGRDRESGGTGGGEVGGLATHPRHVERRWVVQRDDGCGGAHVADGAAPGHVAGLRRA